MSQQPPNVGADQLIFVIKSAYWVALLIIAAMAMASYMLLQQMMGAQQHDEALLVAGQHAEGAVAARRVPRQRGRSTPTQRDKPQLIASLKKATAEFEKNYDQLLDSTGADAASPARNDPTSIENVLFAKPFHLDYFSMGLAANGWRFISAVETDLGVGQSRERLSRRQGAGAARRDRRATRRLPATAELGERIDAVANATTARRRSTSTGRCSTRPSPSSSWWRCSSSGRCPR